MHFQSRVRHGFHVRDDILRLLPFLDNINRFLICRFHPNKDKSKPGLLHQPKRNYLFFDRLHVASDGYPFFPWSKYATTQRRLIHLCTKFFKPITYWKSARIVKNLFISVIYKIINFFHAVINCSKPALFSLLKLECIDAKSTPPPPTKV